MATHNSPKVLLEYVENQDKSLQPNPVGVCVRERVPGSDDSNPTYRYTYRSLSDQQPSERPTRVESTVKPIVQRSVENEEKPKPVKPVRRTKSAVKRPSPELPNPFQRHSLYTQAQIDQLSQPIVEQVTERIWNSLGKKLEASAKKNEIQMGDAGMVIIMPDEYAALSEQEGEVYKAVKDRTRELNSQIKAHAARLGAKASTSWRKRIVKALLSRHSNQDWDETEEETEESVLSSATPSTNPMDYINAPIRGIVDADPLAVQYYEHLFDMVGRVPDLHDLVKRAVYQGYAKAQVIEQGERFLANNGQSK